MTPLVDEGVHHGGTEGHGVYGIVADGEAGRNGIGRLGREGRIDGAMINGPPRPDEQPAARPVPIDYASPQVPAHPPNASLIVAISFAVTGLGALLYFAPQPQRDHAAFGWLAASIAMLGSMIAAIPAVLKGRSEHIRRGGRWIAGCTAICALLCGAVFINLANRSTGPQPPRLRCQYHLRLISAALLMYAQGNSGYYPADLAALLPPVSADWLVCPATTDKPAVAPTTQQIQAMIRNMPGHLSYVYLAAGQRRNDLPKDFILVYEPLANHAGEHGSGIGIVRNDGYVDWVGTAEANWILGELAQGRNPPRPMPGSKTRAAPASQGAGRNAAATRPATESD
jgi:hypothetical protein